MSSTCQRCTRDQRGSRRFRCVTCERLVCCRCCNRGGSGQGQGSQRWAECFDCQKTRETKRSGPPGRVAERAGAVVSVGRQRRVEGREMPREQP